MFKKIIFTTLIVLYALYGNAQKSLNDYKYIIIPNAFEFSKSDDQYQLNSLTKFLFNKYGYKAYSIDELSEDLKKDRCLALTADVSNDEGGMFKTKLEIILKDCYNEEIMRSKIGESRIKEFKKAYHEALRDAFETFQNLDYKYEGKGVANNMSKPEPQIDEKPMQSAKVVSQTTPKKEEITKEVEAPRNLGAEIYYAQSILNGYQLVNSEPRIVMILLKSSAKEVFIVKDKNAIVFKKDGQWIYSENDEKTTTEKVLNIKF
ncbi:hypothetical protein [Winogradskyella sediminis]|uniref:Uncharacterized protein n=1 Tax=Winogradskyella sediminis TaxID=1382466 RepID=A0A1H1UI86_9FLAO|nr:hypothetical protein [Winogradskyella sediminis]SDS72153.1 hypothetical protein SAMN04489797_2258 [Winogradskyella sediminis]